MSKYELALLIKPLLPEDIKNRVAKDIEAEVNKHEGQLTLKLDWGKRHLAYEIKGHQEGVYMFYSLEIAPAKVQTLSDFLKTQKDILRFLIIDEDNL